MDLTAYKDLYDFSLIERAVQSYFVSQSVFVQPPDEDDPNRETWIPDAGDVAFFTAFEEKIFQMPTPRVVCAFNNIVQAARQPHGITDNNGAIRNNLWSGNLRFSITTQPSYSYHTQLRAMMVALGEMIAPMVSDPTKLIGANQYLSNLQIAYVQPQSIDTSIVKGESGGVAFYHSGLSYQLTFGIYEQAILAVTET